MKNMANLIVVLLVSLVSAEAIGGPTILNNKTVRPYSYTFVIGHYRGIEAQAEKCNALFPENATKASHSLQIWRERNKWKEVSALARLDRDAAKHENSQGLVRDLMYRARLMEQSYIQTFNSLGRADKAELCSSALFRDLKYKDE